MSKYKLVPMEKLKEWEATINTIALQTAFDIADDIAQYSYAPAVQVEPVAEVVWSDVEGRRGGFRQFGHHSSPRLPAGTKLYTHPQPAEQQPVYQRCEYCDGTGDVHSIDGEWRGACDCQQPAPDVATLLEALEDIAQWTERWTTPGHPVAKAARKALADYRKGDDV